MRAKDTVMNRKQASKVIDGLPPNELFGYMIGDRQPWKFIAKAQAELTWQRISEEIKKGLLTEQEIRMSCLGEGNYYAGELGNVATETPPVVMPQFSRVAQAQLQKILALLK